MKTSVSAFFALLLAGVLGSAMAQAPADAHDDHHPLHPSTAVAPASQASDATVASEAHNGQAGELSEGEITRWDARTLKLTLRHGEIKNLGMPPMAMVFRVQDASVVGALKPGDKVRFRAEEVNGAYTVTQLEAAQ